MIYAPWTGARVATLKKLWLEGQSAGQIATHLGDTTRNAVIGQIHKAGMARKFAPGAALALPLKAARATRRTTPAKPAKTRTQHRAAQQDRAPHAPPSHRNRAIEPAEYERIAALAPVVFESGKSATILTLTPSTCRYPTGDPRDANFSFCGRGAAVNARGGNKPYCAEHAKIAYAPTKPKTPATQHREAKIRVWS